nr:hypothetical protein [uncultured Olsenella sp.]
MSETLRDVAADIAGWAEVPERTCHFRIVREHIPGRRFRGDICECDRCGYRCARGFIKDEMLNFCPNCGARILGGDE